MHRWSWQQIIENLITYQFFQITTETCCSTMIQTLEGLTEKVPLKWIILWDTQPDKICVQIGIALFTTPPQSNRQFVALLVLQIR